MSIVFSDLTMVQYRICFFRPKDEEEVVIFTAQCIPTGSTGARLRSYLS